MKILRLDALIRTDASEENILVLTSPVLLNLMMEAIRSSETSVHTNATRCNIPEDGILHSHCHEKLKSYITLTS
jgi:hypothetical protein